MDPNLLPLVIFLVVALIAAAVLLIVRDLRVRRGETEERKLERDENLLDLGTLLPPTEMEAASAKNDSWFGQLVAATGSDFTPDTAFLLAVISGLALGGALFLWRDDLLAGAAGAVVGVLAVGGLLFFLRFRRNNSIQEQLPDVMELMARAIRAGESLDQAIVMVGDSALRPLAAEFRYCASQMKVGLSLESAVRGLVGRVPLAETRILAMTLIVQRRRGGNLPITLDRLARVFRDRANFYRQFRAAAALGRGSAIGVALFALGMDAAVIFGHTDFTKTLLTTTTGREVFSLALALQVVGITWILWLFRSRY